MYDKGCHSTKIISSPEGGLRTIRKPELEENIKIFGKKIYIPLLYLKRNSVRGYSGCILNFCLFWDYLTGHPKKPPFDSFILEFSVMKQL